jgi:probable rRNA maturation factor
MIRADIINTTSANIDEAAMHRGISHAETKATQAGIDVGDRFVSIEVVSPDEMRELNKRWRNKDYPTDILSISANEQEVGEQVITESEEGELHFALKSTKEHRTDWPVLGQIIICFDIIREHAKSAGQPIERELEWVIEHGVLHLLGFHHDEN